MNIPGNRALYVVAALVMASVASASGVRGVINTQKMQFTGIAAGSSEGRVVLRTAPLEFTGTAGAGASR